LKYVLGLDDPSGRAAIKGTIVHKVMEVLGNVKKCVQDGVDVCEDKALGNINIDLAMTSDEYIAELLQKSFAYYTDPSRSIHHHKLTEERECLQWVFKALSNSDGIFDPRKRDIIAVEPYFEIELDYPWATYDYGDGSKGQLVLKGTIDLVTKTGENRGEVIDWKTGGQKDWAKGIDKNFFTLLRDTQLMIYHYALTQKYPDINHWAMTMNYINKDGAHTMPYGPKELVKTEQMLKRQFERIQQTTRPQLKPLERFFCSRVCTFGKDMSKKDPTKTICQYTHDKLLKHGMQKVIAEDTKPGFSIDYYHDPGS
jgi:hypothetical protein